MRQQRDLSARGADNLFALEGGAGGRRAMPFGGPARFGGRNSFYYYRLPAAAAARSARVLFIGRPAKVAPAAEVTSEVARKTRTRPATTSGRVGAK